VTGVFYIDHGLHRIEWAIFGAGCLAKAMHAVVCILVWPEMWWHEQQAKPAALAYVFLPWFSTGLTVRGIFGEARRTSLPIGSR